MADEDEIDVLGDFNDDSFFAKSASDMYNFAPTNDPNCDCGSTFLVSQYLDHAPWCAKINAVYTDLSQAANSGIKEVTVVDESGWTTNEKNMLERGIEIFGTSSTRLSQFIGTKTASEIKHYLTHSVHSSESIKEIVLDSSVNESTVGVFENTAVYIDEEIPTCSEEVVAEIKPVPHKTKSRRRSSSDVSDSQITFKSIPSGASLLKNNVYRHKKSSSTSDDDSEPVVVKRKKVIKKKKSPIKLPKVKKTFVVKKVLSLPKVLGKSEPENATLKVNYLKDKKALSLKKMLGKSELENATLKVNYIKDVPRVVASFNGEEVVKIDKVESDCEIDIENDEEIDVENIDDETKSEIISDVANNSNHELQICVLPEEISNTQESDKKDSKEISSQLDLSNLSEEIIQQLENMEVPKQEVVLDENEVTDLEKCIHNEYFNGGQAKTQSRYLKIRNHIMSLWVASKPNYVTKTSVRAGLKKCGDVNTISRIHQYLEQIGAINFGCEQTTYSRPLLEIMSNFIGIRTKKLHKEPMPIVPRLIGLSRPRVKRKFETNGDGGLTSMHDENGEIINTIVVSETPAAKPRIHHKKPMPKLIYCKQFTEDNPPEYSIRISTSAVLLMDLHSHISRTEIMGLVGGDWDSKNKVLTVTRYVPCKNLAHSQTHCEMCPLSQANAGDIIHNEGLDILGWFHSHPTFAPEPSQQDLDTQLLVQKWIGINKPCIGVILSPFSTALISSPYRCMIVKHVDELDRFIPYKFDVTFSTSNLNVGNFFDQAWQIINTDYCSSIDRLNFSDKYFLDPTISHLEKFISSVKMHLAKSSHINEDTCDMIISGLSQICSD